jgi:putative FmdB family regulatory protein
MPNYDFQCKSKKCGKHYEEMASYDETGKYPSVSCPHCGSKRKLRLVTACNFQFANPEGTDRWNSESGGHGYRFQHNLPKVINERMRAEQASHMGTDVYNPINDLNKDSSWGEVK